MENKINIAELLEGAPIGTRLYSPIFGELAYIGSSDQEGMTYSVINCQYPDRVEKGDSFDFDENGRYLTNKSAIPPFFGRYSGKDRKEVDYDC